MFNGKQVEHDVREQILFGYMESLVYEQQNGKQFSVEMDTEDGENRMLVLSYGKAKETIPWDVAFLDGVIAETVDNVYDKGKALM